MRHQSLAQTTRRGRAAEAPPPGSSWTWPAAAAALVLASAALLALFRRSAEAAVEVWLSSPTFTHAFLILPISLFLIWERRRSLALHPPRSSWRGLPVLVAAGAVWLVGRVAEVMELQHFALVGMLQGLFLTVLGPATYRRLLFPLLFLFFMVPTGTFLIPPLQDFTAAFIVGGLRLLEIPVYSDGYLISTPSGDFAVAEACAGLRFLIAAIAFGTLYAHLMLRSPWRRLLFVALSATVPVLANGLRALGIVLIAHYSDMKLAVGVDHLVYGWGFFAALILFLAWVGRKLREPAKAAGRPAPSVSPPGSPVAIGAAALLAVGLAALPRGYAENLASRAAAAPAASFSAPAVAAPWREVPADGWRPRIEAADAEHRAAWRGDSGEVQLYVGLFHGAGAGERLIAWGNRMADGETWRLVGQGAAEAALAGAPLTVAERRLSGSGKRLVWYWYLAGGEATARPLLAKLLLLRGDLLGRGASSAIIAVAADYGHHPDEAERRLRAFLAAAPGLASPMTTAKGGD